MRDGADQDIAMHEREMATFYAVLFEQHMTNFGLFVDNFLPVFQVLVTGRRGGLHAAVHERIESQLPEVDPTIGHSILVWQFTMLQLHSSPLQGCVAVHSTAARQSTKPFKEESAGGSLNKSASALRFGQIVLFLFPFCQQTRLRRVCSFSEPQQQVPGQQAAVDSLVEY